MTTPSSQAGTRPAQSTPAEALRAAADFIESSGQRSGVIVACSAGGVRIRVSEPYGDAAARHAIVTRLAGLIGGTVRQEDERDFATADLRADGAIGGLRAVVSTGLDVRRTRPRTGRTGPAARRGARRPDHRRFARQAPRRLALGYRTRPGTQARTQRPGKQRNTAPALPAAEARRARGPRLPAADRCGPPGGCPAGGRPPPRSLPGPAARPAGHARSTATVVAGNGEVSASWPVQDSLWDAADND